MRVQLRDEIRRIQTDLGITTLFVTHDQEEALAVADRVAVMRSGNIEQIGTPEDLYTRPATSFVATFIGLSNTLDARLSGWHRHRAGHRPATARHRACRRAGEGVRAPRRRVVRCRRIDPPVRM